jgi:hypothetical protein
VKQRCCRSLPRCGDCPVRALAARRAHRERSETAALVAEILGGRPPRTLPDGIARALDRLEPAPQRA